MKSSIKAPQVPLRNLFDYRHMELVPASGAVYIATILHTYSTTVLTTGAIV